jgi:hypothetical protein
MSARYDRPERRGAAQAGSTTRPVAAADSASMWESLSGGDDPTVTRVE